MIVVRGVGSWFPAARLVSRLPWRSFREPTMSQLELPTGIESKLRAFQRRVWTIKLLEAAGAAVFGLMLSYLLVFALDRFIDTSAGLRATILLVGSVGWAIWFPWMCHRWVWRSRRLDQVARLLKVTHPRLGDYLLGIIELVQAAELPGTSEALCRAALAQAERETRDKEFVDSVPRPRHRQWLGTAGVGLGLAIFAGLLVPAAGWNALQRWLMPWQTIPRYTFTVLEPLPDQMVVPVAEPIEFSARLASDSKWTPDQGSVWLGDHQVVSPSEAGRFDFRLPPLNATGQALVRIGDVRHAIILDPQPRPELSELSASIELPAYLQRSAPIERPLRGGGLTVVQGSRVSLTATATRELANARVNGQNLPVEGSVLQLPAVSVDETPSLELEWQDRLGLSAKSPLQLKLRTVEDQPPSLVCRDLEQQRVLMERDVLTFAVDAADDFGIQRIGMTWTGKPAPGSPATAAQGEKIIWAGSPEATEVSGIAATFSPASEGIAPQAIGLRLFVEDYLPDRQRVYSPVYNVFVLSEDEHAIWMTRRLDEWYKQALEVYEREQQLFQRNLELRGLPAAELDRPETRRKIEGQATAETAQARRLEALTQRGEGLVQEAARNENFGVDHLEKLAAMMQQLQAIHESRMPSVADLLKQAAAAAAGEASPPGPPQASGEIKAVTDAPTNPGQAQAATGAASGEEEQAEGDKPGAPSVSLKESNMNAADDKPGDEEAAAPPAASSPPTLKLPGVTLEALPDKGSDSEAAACPAGNQMQAAVAAQEELLAEFQKVAEELQKLISNLEGSTFVKRLKALSRHELVLANDVTRTSLVGFGEAAEQVAEATRERTGMLAERQRAYITTVENIVEDLSAYLTRNPDGKYKTVLEEMQETSVTKQVGIVADRLLTNEAGTSVAHAEWLADTLDRWAEQLVGPG